ncbi:Kinase, NEK [Giardia lamblia P15]|uniref:non-specific serine/threonine protein kinase n=1 Tax=Giardia intestinalis (strain P15) TaxID=658858 RepID=E1F026_GIAIA|nr:Kinase, NEK [Giardia lamblia P15]
MLCPALAEEFYIGRTIGQGSYGAVRVLKDKVTSTVVLCKEFNLSDLDDSAFSSLMYDLSLASHLEYQFLLHYERLIVYDEGSTLFAISSQIGAYNLADLISKHQCANMSIPEACILTILRSVAQALAFLHKEARPLLFARIGGEYTETPVLHNDLKPSNVLVMSNNQLLVTDYGTARSYKLKRLASTFSSSLPYIAPEILHKKEPTEASDVWSLGCLVYELCTLKRFVERANTVSEASSFIASLKDVIIPKSYSKHLAKLIKHMLSVNADDRPSVDDILKNKLLESAKPSIHLEHLTGSMTATYKTANIPNITARLDIEPCNIITASSSTFGDSSLYPSGGGVDLSSGRGSRIGSRSSSTAMGRRNVKSTKIARSLASSLAFNRSLLASSARSHVGSGIDPQDTNANTISSPNFYALADTVVGESATKCPSNVHETQRTPTAAMADSSLAYLRLLKKNVCSEASNRLTSQKPYRLRGPLEADKNAVEGTPTDIAGLSAGRSVSLRVAASKLNDGIYSTPGPDTRISTRLPDSLRRSTSTHVSLYENCTRTDTERITDFISESKSKLQLLDSICLSRHTHTSIQHTASAESKPNNQNMAVTPIFSTGQSLSSPSFTIDLSHPDNIRKVTNELTSSIIEVLVPNQQSPSPHVFLNEGLPPVSPTNLTASHRHVQQQIDDRETTELGANIIFSKSIDSTIPAVPPNQDKMLKGRGFSKRKVIAKSDNKATYSTNEQISNVLISKLGNSLIAKKLHDADQKKRGRTPQSVTSDPKSNHNEIKCLNPRAQSDVIPNATLAMGPMPIPSVPTITGCQKRTPKQKAHLMRSRSKSIGGRPQNKPHEYTPPVPAPPRLSLPAADDRYALSIFLGDSSNFNIESSSSSNVLPDLAFNVHTPKKLQVPKVPQITVQRREKILQNTAMPTAPTDSVQHVDGARSLTTPIKKRTFVPSPPPLTKPHLLEKGRNFYEHSA